MTIAKFKSKRQEEGFNQMMNGAIPFAEHYMNSEMVKQSHEDGENVEEAALGALLASATLHHVGGLSHEQFIAAASYIFSNLERETH